MEATPRRRRFRDQHDLPAALHADEHGAARAACLAAQRARAFARSARRAADDDPQRCRGVPAQRRGPGDQCVVGLAAHDGVDDQRLLAGVPGAAGLGGTRVDGGGGEGDLAAEPQDAFDERVPLGLVRGQRREVVLEHVGGDAHEVDGLAERQPLGQVARSDAEGLRREPDRLAALAQPRHEVRDARSGSPAARPARWSAGSRPNHGWRRSISARQVAASLPEASSMRRRVACDSARRHVRQHGNSAPVTVVVPATTSGREGVR